MPTPTSYNSELYRNAIASGNVDGIENVLIRGVNLSMTSNSAQTIWNQGGDYTFLSAETPLYLSSSSASDVNTFIVVEYLDRRFNQFSVSVQLTGQSQVLVANNCYRVNDTRVLSGGFLQGEVYLAESDTLSGGVPNDATKIKDKISLTQLAGESGEYASASVSWSANFTVPNGKILLLDRYYASSTGSQEGVLTGRFRPDGETHWTSRNEVSVATNFDEVFSPPVPVSAGTDFQTRGTGSNGSVLSIRYEGVLKSVD